MLRSIFSRSISKSSVFIFWSQQGVIDWRKFKPLWGVDFGVGSFLMWIASLVFLVSENKNTTSENTSRNTESQLLTTSTHWWRDQLVLKFIWDLIFSVSAIEVLTFYLLRYKYFYIHRRPHEVSMISQYDSLSTRFLIILISQIGCNQSPLRIMRSAGKPVSWFRSHQLLYAYNYFNHRTWLHSSDNQLKLCK